MSDRFTWDAGQFTITRPKPKVAPKIAAKSAKRGDRKGHPFRGNRYTGGIKRDNGEGAM